MSEWREVVIQVEQQRYLPTYTYVYVVRKSNIDMYIPTYMYMFVRDRGRESEGKVRLREGCVGALSG